jgi:hypothetical protein
MAKSFAALPLLALASAALLSAAPTSLSAAAPAHHPARKAAAHKAAAPDKVSAWLKQCDTEELLCENRLLKVPFAKTACIAPDDADSYVLTPKVRAWFAAHPGHDKDRIDSGINTALIDLYPCPK